MSTSEMMLGFERADAGFKVTFVSYLKLSCKIARMKNMSLKQGQFSTWSFADQVL